MLWFYALLGACVLALVFSVAYEMGELAERERCGKILDDFIESMHAIWPGGWKDDKNES